ncbi:acyl-CoA N-acyltransferase [Xylariaceae sp. FL0255]|nr:acyl-CoA N-acyltransferase [Xylariaceae sp. FL0255]
MNRIATTTRTLHNSFGIRNHRRIARRYSMALPFPHPAYLPPGFSMSRCSPADLDGMTDVYMQAFKDSGYTWWWGPLDTMYAWTKERIRRRFADAKTQQFKIVDDNTGRVVAWSKWDPPPRMTGLQSGFVVYGDDGSPITDTASGSIPAGISKTVSGGEDAMAASAKSYAQGPPEGCDVELFEAFFGALVAVEKKWEADEKLVLTHLCTHPEFHGRGLGAALLRSVLNIADKEGIPAYLESLVQASPLYRRTGFEIVDELMLARDRNGKLGSAKMDIMVREPRSWAS